VYIHFSRKFACENRVLNLNEKFKIQPRVVGPFKRFLVTLPLMVFPKQFGVYTVLFFLLVVSWFSFLNHLGYEPMHLWDESSYALNAQEMIENGNPIEISLFGKPDFYNSKPPFAIWCMALSMKVFGFNETAVRLPSAMFGVLTVFLLFWIGYKTVKDEWLALCAPLVMVSSTGFIGEHIARTGDTDAILACWILAQCCFFFLYTLSSAKRDQQRYLLLTVMAIILGCLTKGIAGLVALPGIFAWAIYQRKLKHLFMDKTFYLGLFVFVVCVPGYYFLRNILNPGYLDAVFNFEVGGRLAQQQYLNPEYRPFYFYYQSMLDDGRLVGWIFALPAAVIYILLSPKSTTRQLGLFWVFVLAGVSFSLGCSKTKLFWYDAPLYPFIAGVIGMAAVLVYENKKRIFVVTFIAAFTIPYATIVKRNIYPGESSHFRSFFNMLRQSEHGSDSIYIINADANFPLHFYVKQDEMNGYYSKLVHPDDSTLKPGDRLLTEKYARRVDIHNRFLLDTLQSFYECNYYKIVGVK
jgi:4-amino-4-deoxy-L-arabinose transferase-like glycosyltransferase